MMRRTLLLTSIACFALTLFLTSCGDKAYVERSDTRGAAGVAANNSPTATTSPVVSGAATPDFAGATKAPPVEVVRASAAEIQIRAGSSAEAQVRLDIAEGFHVNANPPTHSYLIATELKVVAEDGITAGRPAYPAALTKKFAFDLQPLAVYEKEAVIRLPLSAAANAAKGGRTLRAEIRVQPCDMQACYPPRTVAASIPLTIN